MDEMNQNSEIADIMPPKKKGINWLLIGMITALVLILGAGGYFAYGKYFGEKAVDEVVVTTGSNIGTTTDWKTYTNTVVGFSFKYPTDWADFDLSMIDSLKNGVGGKFIASSDGLGQSKTFNVIAYSKDYIPAPVVLDNYLKVRQIDPDWTLAEFKSSMQPSGAVTPLAVKKLGDKAILLVEYFNMECSPNIDVKIVTPLNSTYPNLEISLDRFSQDTEVAADIKSFGIINGDDKDACDPEKTYQQITDKLLSGSYPTIQAQINIANLIANSLVVDETLAWKTYTNTAAKFSVKYPANWTAEDNKVSNDLSFVYVGGNMNPNSDSPLTITIQNKSYDTVVAAVDEGSNWQTGYSKTSITFNGTTATKITYTAGSSTYQDLIFSKNNLTYHIYGILVDGTKKNGVDLGLFQSISQTFQFSE